MARNVPRRWARRSSRSRSTARRPRRVNPHVPRSPAEITSDALACIDAGATIVHNHNDEPMSVHDGVHRAEPYLEAWRPIVERHPDVQLYATQASGGPRDRDRDAVGAPRRARPGGRVRVGFVDPGSVSLGRSTRRAARPSSTSTRTPMRVTWSSAAPSSASRPASRSSIRASCASRSRSRAGALPPGTMIKLYFGGDALPFGFPPTGRASTPTSRCSTAAACRGSSRSGRRRRRCGLGARALERGGHVRVGLEDHAGPRTPSNVELVEEAAKRSPRPAVASSPPPRRARSSADRGVTSYVKEFRYGFTASTETLVTP